MISLQYIAIFRLNPMCFLAASVKKKKVNRFEVACSVYAWGCVSFGLSSERDLPGAQLCSLDVDVLGGQDAAWDWGEESQSDNPCSSSSVCGARVALVTFTRGI